MGNLRQKISQKKREMIANRRLRLLLALVFVMITTSWDSYEGKSSFVNAQHRRQ